MNYSLDKLPNSIELLNDSFNQLSFSFDCQWYDEVHDSYELYILQCKTATQGIEGIVGALIKNCAELESIQPDQICQDAEIICEEVNSFS